MKKKSMRSSAIDALLKNINKDFGDGRVVIARGRDITWTSAKRRSTGSLGLDIALNGGVPMGMIVQFMGEESSGKTTMAFKVAAEIQRALGEDAAVAFVSVEGFDKKWAVQCGCSIAFTKDELRMMSEDEHDQFVDVEDVGSVVLATATTGEDALELALKFIRSNKFHLVVIDSMAGLIPQAEEERPMDEKTMGKSPAMIGEFLRKCGAALNTLDDDNRNETSVILLNQVRDQIGGYGHPQPYAPGGRALKHWPVASVRFIKGELLKEGDKESKLIYGKRTKIRVEKCKIGPAYREAEFEFYFAPYQHFKPGDIDIFQETRYWGVKAGIIRQTSNVTYEYEKHRFQGKAKVEAWLRKNPEILRSIRKQTLAILTSAAPE